MGKAIKNKKEDKKLSPVSDTTVVKLEKEELWVNPVGGYGDILMLSGVLKLAYDKDPLQKYNLVRRTKYTNLLKGHPAIKQIGFPPKDAKFVNTNYWNDDNYESGKNRAFQLLAESFGLKTPVEEKLFLAGGFEEDPLLDKIIPWKKKNIIICPTSDSPRKIMHPIAWHNIVQRLTAEGVFVVQVGKISDLHIKGAYSLLNLTSPRQLISLLKKCNFVITSDNFIMHAAHLVEKPAVVLWGPTKSSVYGYKEHKHIEAPLDHCNKKNECLGPRFPQHYPTVCPLGPEHCMNKISLDQVFNSIFTLL
ncbi:MAG TPA: glycosyltransferase family 9 protein [Bacteroidales bacterium]|nr:glycosyltransferase family 9 protein [Bacteroidales bacterium]